MSERDFDVVVFGATSVTGRRVAAYLDQRSAATGMRWAAAARNPEKLERTLAEVGIEAAETISADVGDPESLAAMAARAGVVLNLVGPYTRYGAPVIAACVGEGASYVDLTGEIPFVRRMIDAHDEAARAAGVKIVQVCGFEALPPDLAVALASETARQRWDERLAEVELEVAVISTPPGVPRASDFISGGTFQSMVEVTRDPDAERIADPALLVDDPERAEAVRRVSPITVAPRRNARGAVIAPMSPAAFINPAVIQRSAALLAATRGEPFEPFRYREGMAMPGSALTLPARYLAAGAMAGIQGGLSRAAGARPAIRARISKAMGAVLPGSGFGPAADRLEDWNWRMQVRATTPSGNPVEVFVDADGHPGYLATARMMGEAGLLLAEPGATPEGAGCRTPAAALGIERIDRFAEARLRFSVAPPS